MPGILGFVGHFGDETVSQNLLEEMARSLESGDHFQVDLYQKDEVALGRVTLGIVCPEEQPIWNEDESVCLVMEGELYDTQQLKEDLQASSSNQGGNNR